MNSITVQTKRISAITIGRISLVMQVVGFNGRALSSDRLVYIDNSGRWWRKNNRSYEAYRVQRNGMFAFSFNGKSFLINPNTVNIDDEDDGKTVADCRPFDPDAVKYNHVLQIGKIYKLKNGEKAKIVAFEDDRAYAPVPTFVGLYIQSGTQSGTQSGIGCAIRFDANGKLLSHGRESRFEIVGEWKPEFIWTLVFKNRFAKIEARAFSTKESLDSFVSANCVKVIETYCKEV